jgi:hypothetical protein
MTYSEGVAIWTYGLVREGGFEPPKAYAIGS